MEVEVGVAVCACAALVRQNQTSQGNKKWSSLSDAPQNQGGPHRYYPQLNDLRQEVGRDAACSSWRIRCMANH